jgi:hypothetical protein
VDEDKGVVRVFVGRTSHPAGLPAWLEFGTWKMTPRPFLLVNAELEAPGHLARVSEAMNQLVSEVGG